MPALRAALGAALAATLLSTACLAQEAPQQPQGFIRVMDGRFVDDATCDVFLFAGWNGWALLDRALSDPNYITRKFQQAQAARLNLLRFFVAGDDGSPVLMPAPGQLDDRVARGLDFILAEAAKYGVRLTPVFLNLWKQNNGVPQFEQWCGTASSNYKPRPDLDIRTESTLNETERLQTPVAWLQSPACRQQVKDFMSLLVNRRNSITGLLYRDDPTIFSWNLFNEPRCKYCGPQPVNDWYGELAAHLKSIDPNHLVTTGEEGYFDEADPQAPANPNDGNMWASRSGQDFRANHAHPAIDYAVMHLWPDNWQKAGPLPISFGQQWIDTHARVASELGKPLVLEEFGKNAGEQEIGAVRDPWFDLVHGAVDASLQSRGPLRGALFWQWDGESGPRPDAGSNIRDSDSTFTHKIAPFAHKLAEQPPTRVPGCTPRGGAASLAAPAPVPAPAGGAPSSTQGPQQASAPQSAGRRLLSAKRA